MSDLSKKLVKLSLVVAFGRRSDKPFTTSVIRSFGAALACGIFGTILAFSLWRATLPKDLPALLIIAAISVTTFVISGFVLLATGNLSTYELGELSVYKQLVILPLDRRSRWLVRVLPLFMISAILACFFCPIIAALSHSMGISMLFCFVSLILGLTSSIGYVLLRFASSFVVKTAVFIGLNLLLFGMIDLVVRSTITFKSWPLIVDLAILLSLSFGIVTCYFGSKQETYKASKFRVNRLLPLSTIYQSWFITKLFRNRRSLGSVIFAFIVSVSLSLIIYFKHETSVGGIGWLLFAGFLICSYASDVRGLSRRHKTPEIVALKGVNYFVDIQLFSSLIVNTIIAMPLYLLVVTNTLMPIPEVTLYFTALVVAGSVCGLFSGTIFVPESKEIGSQFMAVLLAASLLIMLPRILKFSNLSLSLQSASWFCVAATAYLLMILMEQARRKRYGHA